jgi:hypothetical protein
VLGSDLTAEATVSEAHRVDVAFWPVALPGGGVAATADGQVLGVALKGTALKSTTPLAPDPVTTAFVQTLEPQRDGTLEIVLTSASFEVPSGGDPNQITKFAPENLCIRKGQIVAFNDVGGFQDVFYPDGTPFQVFGAARTSITAQYEKYAGTHNGAIVRGTPRQGEELLLQWVLGTGPDAAGVCGGTKGTDTGGGTGGGTGTGTGGGTTPAPVRPRMSVRYQRVYVSSKRLIQPGAYCPRKAGRCRGTARITVEGKSAATTSFTIAGGHTTHIRMRLARGVYARLRKTPGRRLNAVFAVDSQLGTASHAVLLTQ